MEPLKLSISIPFRVDGKSEEHPGCVRPKTAPQINRYLRALEKEIIASSEDMEDYQVQEIAFELGSFTHLGNDDPKKILQLIKEHYSVNPEPTITLNATPSALNFYRLVAIKQLKSAKIRLEVPSLDPLGLSKAGFETTAEEVQQALDCCFQNGFRELEILISPSVQPSDEAFANVLTATANIHPYKISFDTTPTDEQYRLAVRILTAKGMIEKNGAFYSEEPGYQRHIPEQLGCGLAAVSIMEGVAITSTDDFDFYCDHSEDYEALVTHHA